MAKEALSPNWSHLEKLRSKKKLIVSPPKKSYNSKTNRTPERVNGLILTFNSKPSNKLNEKINQLLASQGLKFAHRGKVIPFRYYIYSPAKTSSIEKVTELCQKLKKFDLQNCIPNRKTRPSNDETEADAGLPCENCSKQDLQDQVEEIQKSAETCDLSPPHSNYEWTKGGLPDLWAQRMSGEDLVDQWLEKKENQEKLSPVSVHVCDTSEGNHGQIVTSIIRSKFSVDVKYIDCSHDDKVFKYMDSLLLEDNPPDFINLSMDMNETDWPVGAIATLKPKGTTVVIAAGNSFDEGKHTVSSQASNINHIAGSILVGSANYLGLPSTFSQEGSEVATYAGSDNYMTVCQSHEADCVLFGGTSGAAPQITRALSLAKSLVPELQPEHYNELIKNTNISSVFLNGTLGKDSRRSFNAYKILKVAEHIQESCQSALSKKICVDRLVTSKSTYRFFNSYTEDSYPNPISSLIRKNFPRCVSTSLDQQKQIGTCSEKKQALETLREMHFLMPEDQKFSLVLGCVFLENEYLVGIPHAESVSMYARAANSEKSIEEFVDLIDPANIQFVNPKAFRWRLKLAQSLPDGEEKFLNKISQISSPGEIERIFEYIEFLGVEDKVASEIFEALQRNPNKEARLKATELMIEKNNKDSQ